PYLLDRLVNPDSGGALSSHRRELARLIVKINDTRTIITLMDYIDEDRLRISFSYGDGPRVVIKAGDVAMAVVLRQTGQDPAEYGFHTKSKWGPIADFHGFTDETKRRNAQAKLRQWWREHGKEYEGVEKIPLKGRPTRRVLPPQSDVPNATDPLKTAQHGLNETIDMPHRAGSA
ncbi:unnamed protein product, partial [marine sediment metagenome]